MKKNIKSLLTISLMFAFAGLAAPSLFSKALEVSEGRFKKICDIVQKAKESGVNLADPAVKKAVYKDISREFILEPKDKPDTRPSQDLADEARKIIAKKYPETTGQVIKKAEAMAEKKFRMHNILDSVSVQYQQGKKTYTVDGIFYAYGGNSIKVGEQFIPIFDLVPEDRVKFDKVFNQQKKKEFVDNLLAEYLTRKSAQLTEIYKELREKQSAKNEELGYIFVYKEWRSPKQAAEIYLSSLIDSSDAPAKQIAAAPKNPQPAPAAASEEGAQPEKAPEKTEAAPAKPSEPEKTPYEELKQKVEKKLLEISNSCAGIDADQGYKMALWGMSREEIELLLSSEGSFSSGEKSASPGEEEYSKKIDAGMVVLDYPKGPIAKVSLFFTSGLFYKVEIDFRLVSNAGMQRLTALLNERYGLTDEQKKLREEMEKSGKVDVDAAEQTGEVVAEDDGKKHAQIPLEQVFHWTGKVTQGKVIIKINKERTSYTEFRLVKENPKIKDEAKAVMIKEEQRKKDEKRKKELEEFNKKPIEF